jgi:actin-like ATPase involved in cell morphogenesis
MFKLSKSQKAALSLALGLVLMALGYAIDPLVHLGYLSPLAGSIIGVCIPLGIEEAETGKVSVADMEAVASKVISLLEGSGRLTPAEQAATQVAGAVVSAVQQGSAKSS